MHIHHVALIKSAQSEKKKKRKEKKKKKKRGKNGGEETGCSLRHKHAEKNVNPNLGEKITLIMQQIKIKAILLKRKSVADNQASIF